MLDLAPFVIATSLVVAIAAVLAIDGLGHALRRGEAPSPADGEVGARLVFHQGRLVDATPGGRAVLASARPDGETPSLADAVAALVPRFPDLAVSLDELGRRGEARFLAADGSADLAVLCSGDLVRLDLSPTDCNAQIVIGSAELDGLNRQVASLRGVAEALPYPVWCTDERGGVSWVNRAYLDLCAAHLGPDTVAAWPLPNLFSLPDPARNEPHSVRLWLSRKDAEDLPFEVTTAPHEGGFLNCAIPADSAVRTETSLRDFVQTLSKTFAQIAIGLAVFSRDRRLALFNPALGELTGLRAETLALRPTLFEFLDTLRDRRVMPEPKDYKAWRQRLADLRNGPGDGELVETWQLADGRTFRVTALPQTEGAMALLFEDITSQMVQSRTFRGTLELHQLVLDRRAEAIAVFAADGALVLCNDPYDALWNTRVADSVSPVSLAESLARWKAATQPSPEWSGFPQAVPRAPWSARVQMTDGRLVECTATGLAGSCLLIEFRRMAAREATGEGPAGQRRLRLSA